MHSLHMASICELPSIVTRGMFMSWTAFSGSGQFFVVILLYCLWYEVFTRKHFFCNRRERTRVQRRKISVTGIRCCLHVLFMAALRSRCGHYIFALWFLSIFLSFFLA